MLRTQLRNGIFLLFHSPTVTMAQGSLLTVVILQCHLEKACLWYLSSDLTESYIFDGRTTAKNTGKTV